MFVAIRICHLIIGMIFQPVSLVDNIVSLVCWMTSIKLRKKMNAAGCALMDKGMSILTKAHSEMSEPGVLCAMKNKLSVLFRILAVNGPIARTLEGGGASIGGGGGLLAAAT